MALSSRILDPASAGDTARRTVLVDRAQGRTGWRRRDCAGSAASVIGTPDNPWLRPRITGVGCRAPGDTRDYERNQHTVNAHARDQGANRPRLGRARHPFCEPVVAHHDNVSRASRLRKQAAGPSAFQGPPTGCARISRGRSDNGHPREARRPAAVLGRPYRILTA